MTHCSQEEKNNYVKVSREVNARADYAAHYPKTFILLRHNVAKCLSRLNQILLALLPPKPLDRYFRFLSIFENSEKKEEKKFRVCNLNIGVNYGAIDPCSISRSLLS